MPMRTLTLLALPALLLASSGCEMADPNATEETAPAATPAPTPSAPSGSGSTSPAPSSPTAATDPATVDDAQAEWDNIQWNGPSAVGAKQVMTLSASVQSNAKYVNFTFDRFPWSSAGLGHFFVWDGTRWRGGKFDWIRTGGQSLKGTENIAGHYNGLSIPPSGSAVAFAWTDAKGTQRSNLAKTTWP